MNYVVRANIEAHINYDILCDYVYVVWLYVCDMWFDTVPIDMTGTVGSFIFEIVPPETLMCSLSRTNLP